MTVQEGRARQTIVNAVLVVGMLLVGFLAGAGAAKVVDWWDAPEAEVTLEELGLTDRHVQLLGTRAWFDDLSPHEQNEWCRTYENVPRATLKDRWGVDPDEISFDNWYEALGLICE